MTTHLSTQPDPYRFANRLWIDYLLPRKSLRQAAFVLIALSAAPWIIGLIIAAHAGRANAYVHTPTFYLGFVGILVTLATLAYGSVKQYSIFERLLACFDYPEPAQRDTIRRVLARHSDLGKQMRAVGVIFLVCILFATSGFASTPDLSAVSAFFGTRLPRFEALRQYGWYDSNVALHGMAIVLVFSLFVSIPLGTAISVMIRLPRFMWEASSHKPKLPPSLIKAHFSPATTFYTLVSVLWIVCVVFVGYFLGKNEDWLSLSIVGVLFAMGIVNFAIPQLTYVRVTSAAEDLILKEIAANLDGGALKPSPALSLVGPLLNLAKHDDWVYPIHHTYIMVGASLLSLISWDAVRRFIDVAF